MSRLVAILSTTVLPIDGTYSVKRIELCDTVSIIGVPHYVGHPATKEIVESLGAVPAESKLFTGLLPGQSALACSIKQGLSSRVVDGFTSPHQEVTKDMLDFRLITRAEICGFCGKESRLYPLWHCAGCGAT
jgi:hypothetical protein